MWTRCPSIHSPYSQSSSPRPRKAIAHLFFFFGIFHDNNVSQVTSVGLRVSASHDRRYSTKIYLRGMLLLHAQGMKAEALFVYDLPLSHQPDQMPPSSFLIRKNYSLSLSLRAIALLIFFTFVFVAPPSHALDQLQGYLCRLDILRGASPAPQSTIV